MENRGAEMSPDFEKYLNNYAEVAVKVALNVQPGQRVLIGRPAHGVYGIPIELAPLVRRIVAKAYDVGAKLVDVMWNDDELRLIRFKHAPAGTIEEFPTWRSAAAIEYAEAGEAMLSIYGEDPGLLAGQDVDMISKFTQSNSRHMAPYFEAVTKNLMNWAVMTAPVAGWTEKVFPGLSTEEANAKAWDTLFDICRMKGDDPVADWKKHVADLVTRSDYMNAKQYAALKLKSPDTDLTIGMPQGHIWCSTRMTTPSGTDFTANVPSEEIFSTPHNKKIDGYVTLSKPLNYGGSTIEGLRVTFSKGRVTEVHARKGEDLASKMLSIDDGAKSLGEIALVPHSSPISQSGLVFYSTLIDENASSHMAFGRAYRFGVKDGAKMSDDEFDAIGGNTSLIHVDCMIGSGEMDVDGVGADGSSEPVMRRGEWAFKA
jgi:aminopeptidase